MFRTCGPPSAYELRTSSEFADEPTCPECGEPIGTPNATLIAAAPALLEALVAAQAALAMMVQPDAIKKTTVTHAFAQATAAEAKARAAIQSATGGTE